MKNSAYFAQDAMRTKTIIAQLNECQQELAKSQSNTVYWAALIDSAFDYPVNDHAPYLHDGINCFPRDIYQSLNEAAPWLLPLGLVPLGLAPLPEENEAQLQRLIRHCSERPMLSFIASDEPIHKLKEAWKNVHWVSDADHQKMLLRIADTRTLPSIATTLSPTQWAAFTAPLAHWLYVNREGQLEALVLAPKAVQVDETIQLTQAQLNAFLEAAQPDALIDFLVEEMRDVIPDNIKRSAFYRLIEQSCKIAQTHSVTAFNDQVSLAVAACLTLGESNQNAELHELLATKTWVHGKLGEVLATKGIV